MLLYLNPSVVTLKQLFLVVPLLSWDKKFNVLLEMSTCVFAITPFDLSLVVPADLRLSVELYFLIPAIPGQLTLAGSFAG